jgi:hypothetical protein
VSAPDILQREIIVVAILRSGLQMPAAHGGRDKEKRKNGGMNPPLHQASKSLSKKSSRKARQ